MFVPFHHKLSFCIDVQSNGEGKLNDDINVALEYVLLLVVVHILVGLVHAVFIHALFHH